MFESYLKPDGRLRDFDFFLRLYFKLEIRQSLFGELYGGKAPDGFTMWGPTTGVPSAIDGWKINAFMTVLASLQHERFGRELARYE